jgi:transcriptional regulator with XRE-family HTH domain
MPVQGPTVTRRRLRTKLRQFREDRQLSIEDVAKSMDWSPSKLIRIENGSVGVSTNDLKMLLELYRVTDAGRVDGLLDLARGSRQRGWWSKYRDRIPGTYADLIGYEWDAAHIWHFQPIIMPGLLQTERYARAITERTAVGASASDIDAYVEIRMERQRVLEREKPPRFTAIVDEAVLHRHIGDPDVMFEQLDVLLEMNDADGIEVVVIPYSSGLHPGVLGPFMLLQFADVQDSDIVFVGHAASDTILKDRPDETEPFMAKFHTLKDLGRRGAEANELIRKAKGEFA